MAGSADEVRERLRAQIAAIEAGGPTAPDRLEEGSRPSSVSAGERVCRAARPATWKRPGCEAGAAGSKSANAPGHDHDGSERAFRKIERLACSREQASEALRRRLAREGFDEAAIEAALSRALACGLVDDRRYADVLVRSRLSQGRGKRGIAAELADLGIDPDCVVALDDPAGSGDDASEVERALAVLDRKPPRSKNRRDAAYRRLVQKGFGASVASTAARQWCEANPE